MKRVLVCAAVVAVLVSCGQKAQTSAVEEAAVDTLSVKEDTVETEAPAFFSDDLKMFGLKGKVKKRGEISSTGGMDTGEFWAGIEFDENGKLLSKHGDYAFRKNKDGFIERTESAQGDGQMVMTYTELDENGWPSVAKDMVESPDYIMEAVYKYTYTEVDEHGNWKARKVKVDIVSQAMDEMTGDYGAKEKSSQEWTETRTLTYYE